MSDSPVDGLPVCRADGSCDLSVTLTRLAKCVRSLITKHDALQLFRDQVFGWGEQWWRIDSEYKKYREKVNGHWKLVNDDERFRNRETPFPNSNYVWAVLDSLLECWMPAELASATRPPKAEIPWPLRERELSRCEEYAVLAAVHDTRMRGVARIDPWACDAAKAGSCQRSGKVVGGRAAYLSLQYEIFGPGENEPDDPDWHRFSTHDAECLGELLKDVAGDLAKPGDLPPLSEVAAAVMEILLAQPPYRGLTGSKILDALSARNPPIYIDQSTLTKRVLKELKPYGIENKPKIGYYIPQSKRNSNAAPSMRP